MPSTLFLCAKGDGRALQAFPLEEPPMKQRLLGGEGDLGALGLRSRSSCVHNPELPVGFPWVPVKTLLLGSPCLSPMPSFLLCTEWIVLVPSGSQRVLWKSVWLSFGLQGRGEDPELPSGCDGDRDHVAVWFLMATFCWGLLSSA